LPSCGFIGTDGVEKRAFSKGVATGMIFVPDIIGFSASQLAQAPQGELV
jgi:hypothetical protein